MIVLTRRWCAILPILLAIGVLQNFASDIPLALPADLPDAIATDGGKLDSPPRLVKRGPGYYPDHLLRTQDYIAGSVIARVALTDAGQVESVKVLSATHPAFISALVTQLAASKFTPGQRDGRPVRSSAKFVARFNVMGSRGGTIGGGVTVIPSKPADLPPERDFDLAPLMTAFCEPVFPFAALWEKRKGEVKLRVFLDATGVVERTEVAAATDADFALAMQAAVETWRFLPAKRNGLATASMFYVERKFIPASYRRPEPENAALKIVRKDGVFAPASALDGAPRLLYQVAPQYPRALLPTHPEGEATVEFVIYETGEVAIPRVISATQPEFGFAAANAIQQWVFEPPRVKRKAVSVRTRMVFGFHPDTKP